MLKRKHTPKRALKVVGFEGSSLSLSESSIKSNPSAKSKGSKSSKCSSTTLIVISCLCASSTIASRIHLEVNDIVGKDS
jgi:hypothetical protein